MSTLTIKKRRRTLSDYVHITITMDPIKTPPHPGYVGIVTGKPFGSIFASGTAKVVAK